MNWESWLVPKNSLIAATTGRMLIRGLRRDRLDVLGRHPLPDHRSPSGPGPDGTWFWMSSPTVRRPAVPEVVDVVGLDRDDDGLAGLHLVLAGVQPDQVLDGGDDVVLGQRALAGSARPRPSSC